MSETPKNFSENENTFRIISGNNGLNNFVLQSNQQKAMNILEQQKAILSPEEFAKQQKEIQALENMRREKAEILIQEFGLTTDKAKIRPAVDTINPDNEAEIVKYVARQNLACAFSCCADSETPARVAELAKIFNEKIPAGQYPHFDLWERENDPNYPAEWAATKQNDPNYASQYFEIHLRDTPQNEAEKAKFLAEFREIYNTFVNKND